MATQILQELSKEEITVTKFEEAILSWHEGYLTVLSEKGVHILELSHNIKCLDKKIICLQSLISHPKYSPVAGLFTNSILNKKLRNVDQCEMIVDQSLWPHNIHLMQEMSVITDFKWSPIGVVNYHSAIAILTNVGVVEIYTQHFHEWQCVLQLTQILSEECSVQANLPQSFEPAKSTAHMLATSAMCWSPIIRGSSCHFVTAQKNGNIIFWLIECSQRDASAKTVGTLQIESCEMQSMLWIPLNSGRFLLVCTNILGQIIVFECQFHTDKIQLLQSYSIWPHKDHMISKFLEYVEVDSNIVLFCNKNRHLLVLLIDKDCIILGHYINNINDYRITSICKVSDEITYITTVNCKVYKLNMAMEGKELNITLDPIEIPCFSSTHELYGIAVSQNKVLTVLCVMDRKVNTRKETLKLEVVITSTKRKLDSLTDLLLSNPTKLLTNYWDVIETLRHKCLKAKEIPAVDFNELYDKAVSDIYLLKVYNLLCTICNSLKKTFKLGPDFQLPENSPETIKEEILVAHAEKVIHNYSQKFKEQGKLMPFETEYFIGAKKFLEYFFQKNKKKLIEVLDPSIMSIVEENTSFICQACEEEVSGFRCKYNHLNMFCALTFTPIETSNYLICKWCNLTARLELLNEKPLCLFCDLPLVCVD